jgi:hypothetical protein
MEEQALDQGQQGIVHRWLQPGRARGGWAKVGGVNWLDYDREFKPVPGLKQIFGHTPHDQPVVSGHNIALDTRSKHYAILQNGVVTVHETHPGMSL